MKERSTMKVARMTAGFYVAGMAVLACTAASADDWEIEGRWVHQWDMRMDVNGPPAGLVHEVWGDLPGRDYSSHLSTSYGDPVPSIQAPTDDLAPRDRTYDDGYVWKDLWTDDPDRLTENRKSTTWNWGALNATDQWDPNPDPQEFDFHRYTQRTGEADSTDITKTRVLRTTHDTLLDRPFQGSDKFDADGIEVSARKRMTTWHGIDLGIDIGLAWFPQRHPSVRDTPFQMRIREDEYIVTEKEVRRDPYSAQYLETYTHPINLGWGSDFIAQNPGSYNWPLDVNAATGPNGALFNGPGPMLEYVPTSYEVTTLNEGIVDGPSLGSSSSSSTDHVGSRSWLVSDDVVIDADVDQLRLALGPTLTRPIRTRWRVHASPQFTLHFAKVDLMRHEEVTTVDESSRERTTIASREDHAKKSDILFGVLLSAGVDWRFTELWFVGAYLGREWVQELSSHVGPDNVTFDLSSKEYGCYLGRHL
jgi:hypothetical protein